MVGRLSASQARQSWPLAQRRLRDLTQFQLVAKGVMMCRSEEELCMGGNQQAEQGRAGSFHSFNSVLSHHSDCLLQKVRWCAGVRRTCGREAISEQSKAELAMCTAWTQERRQACQKSRSHLQAPLLSTMRNSEQVSQSLHSALI